jgi:hypothetical protein
MPKYILYLFFFFTAPCFSQTEISFLIENLDSITNNRVNWKMIEKKILSQKEKDIVRDILEDTTRFHCYNPEYDDNYPNIDLYLYDFHFVDINGDRDLDIIYNGRECPGYESETVHVYLNQKGVYKHTLIHRGTVLTVKNNELIFYQYPCCAEISNVYRVYKIQTDAVELDYGVVFYTLFPLQEGVDFNNFKKSDEIIINKGTDLCFFSEPQAGKYNRYSDEKNCAVQTKETIQTNSYSQFVDEQGEIWQYVLVEKKNILIEDDYLKNNVPKYLMLWAKD